MYWLFFRLFQQFVGGCFSWQFHRGFFHALCSYLRHNLSKIVTNGAHQIWAKSTFKIIMKCIYLWLTENQVLKNWSLGQRHAQIYSFFDEKGCFWKMWRKYGSFRLKNKSILCTKQQGTFSRCPHKVSYIWYNVRATKNYIIKHWPSLLHLKIHVWIAIICHACKIGDIKTVEHVTRKINSKHFARWVGGP